MDEKKKKQTNYISIGEAIVLSGLCAQTLRKLADHKKIISYKTITGQRKFDKLNIIQMCSNVSSFHQRKDDTKINYIYTRFSSRKQSDDLERQIEFIKSQKPEYNTSYKLISDIGSGINFKRQGLITILDSCLQNNIGEVVIAHKDRLSRFGFDLIKLIIEKAGGKITIINDGRNKSTEQELAEDLLSIIHIYSCRQMGKRKYTKTKN
jgi:predicted site-specific integrase-resolvase